MPNGAVAQLQRCARCGDRVPLRGKVVVEAALDAFYREKFGRDPPLSVNADQLDSREPVQPARKPRDLFVMAERRIDKTGGPEKCAHEPAL